MVAGGHDPDHGQGEAHRVEQVIVQSHSFVDMVPAWWSPYSFVDYLILLFLFKFKELLHPDYFGKKKTKDWVADIAQEMVPHDQRTSRLQTLKIVETTILITVNPKTKCDVSGTICLIN